MNNGLLSITRFGNPILRQQAHRLTKEDIASEETLSLIQAMFERLLADDGVGLAAPQVGTLLSLFVVDIHPNKYHPKRGNFRTVVINPEYIGVGKRTSMWEGCLSTGGGKNVLFGKALRYRRVIANYQDEKGVHHKEEIEGLFAQIFQHETDHLNGMLFVDRVRDTKSYMMGDEYRKRIVKKHNS